MIKSELFPDWVWGILAPVLIIAEYFAYLILRISFGKEEAKKMLHDAQEDAEKKMKEVERE